MNTTVKKLIPKLRFSEFSGEWKKIKLLDVGKIITGSTPSTFVDEYYNGEKHFVSPADIQGDRYILKTNTTLTDLGFSKTRKVKRGSVLFVCIGSTIGKVAQASEDCATNQQINAIEPKEDFYDNFIYSLLEKKAGKIKLLAGTQAVPQINKTDFSKLKFAFPQLPEQQKIANFLTAVDTKISQLTKKKALLEQYKKGIMQKIFNQELRFKDEDGNDYPDWESKKLGAVSKIVGGGTPETGKDEYWNGNIQWFTPTEIKSDFVSNSTRTITELGLKKSSAKILPKGTILLTTRATIGEVSIALNDCVTNQGFQSLIVNKGINNVFVFNWIKMNKHQLIKRANGSTFPEISKSEIEKIVISIPNLKEQTKIAQFLSAIDAKINHVNTQLAQTQTFKKGLLQQLFV